MWKCESKMFLFKKMYLLFQRHVCVLYTEFLQFYTYVCTLYRRTYTWVVAPGIYSGSYVCGQILSHCIWEKRNETSCVFKFWKIKEKKDRILRFKRFLIPSYFKKLPGLGPRVQSLYTQVYKMAFSFNCSLDISRSKTVDLNPVSDNS